MQGFFFGAAGGAEPQGGLFKHGAIIQQFPAPNKSSGWGGKSALPYPIYF